MTHPNNADSLTAGLARSFLYVPGDQEAKMLKAAASGADALILDLEDAVAPARKDAALRLVAAFLRTESPIERWVRVDPDLWPEQLPEILGPGLRGLFVPKAESGDELARLCARLDELESAREQGPRSVALIPLIESAKGVGALDEIATQPRVIRLGMGEADLRASLRVRSGGGGMELLFARSSVVLAGAQAGLAGPVASTSTDFRDLAGLKTSSEHLRDLGFAARTAIHPAQIPVVNEAFAPDAAEMAQARRVLAAFDAGLSGESAAVSLDGGLIDPAVVRMARQVVAAAGVTDGAAADMEDSLLTSTRDLRSWNTVQSSGTESL